MQNGFLADETAEAYAEKILNIVSDPERLSAVGEEAHRSVYRTWETVAQEVLAKYEEVIAEYRKKHNA